MSTLEVEALSLQRGSAIDMQTRIGYRLITGQRSRPRAL
jgi:hypothetical protein